MNKIRNSLYSLGLVACVITSAAQAANWQDSLSSAASDLMNSNSASSTGTQANGNGMSLGSIAQLLNGGSKGVTSNNISNVAGILQYCVKNNVIDNNATSITDKLKSKLGLSDVTSQQAAATATNQTQNQQNSYLQGVEGLLNTGGNKKLDLKTLGDTDLGKQLKTKACNVVLNQGKKYLGSAI